MLVALPQSPAKQRPDRHAIRAAKGRDKVLARMVQEGVVAEADAALARREGVPFARQAMPLSAPHLASRLPQSLADTRIVTTLDAALQAAVERMAAQEVPTSTIGAALSIVVVENRTRNVIAYLGGVNYWGAAGQVDLAQRSRSPGSALKPFIYGLAFDDLILHPVDDDERCADHVRRLCAEGFRWRLPGRGDGARCAAHVAERSRRDGARPGRPARLHDCAAECRSDISPFPRAAPRRPCRLRSAASASAWPTSPCSMPASPTAVKRTRSRYVADAPDAPDHRLFGNVAAYYLKQILRGVALPDGWAMGQGLSRQRAVAFKTGTSYGYRDAWSVGFSNDYTVGVWVGQADGSPRPGHVGRDAAAPILLKTFELLPRDSASG